MIWVDYLEDGKNKTKEFLDVYVAKEFIQFIKKEKNVYFLGVRCEDFEDNVFLWDAL